MSSKRALSNENTEEGHTTNRPTADNLKANIVPFCENLDLGLILPELLGGNVISLDDYIYFKKQNERKRRPEVVEELILNILENDAPDNENIQKFYEALLKLEFIELAERLCTPRNAAEPKKAKQPRKCAMVDLKDLDDKEDRFGISVLIQIMHRRSWTNTTAEFVVAEKDEAKRLLVYLQSYDMKQQQYDTGSNLLLCGCAWVGGHLVVSSRDLSLTKTLYVSEKGRAQSELLCSLPKAETASSGTALGKILEARPDSTHSTTVTIVSVELVKKIPVKPEMVPRKDFRIRDDTGEMPAELWRHMASEEISHGQKWCFFGKVVEYKQKKLVFRVLSADCVDMRTTDPDHDWLSTDGHQEGELLSFEITFYDFCSKEGCSNKKLAPSRFCDTCGTSSPMKSLYANMKLLCDGDIVSLTAFCPEISQIYTGLGLDIDVNLLKSQLEDQIHQKMPVVCGVKYEGDIVTNIRMNKRELNV